MTTTNEDIWSTNKLEEFLIHLKNELQKMNLLKYKAIIS